MTIPPDTTLRTWMFHRADVFYVIEPSPICKPEDHAALNPGTMKITDATTGEILWQLQ